MKSTVTKQPCTEETSFPKLIISKLTNIIVLATSKTTGTIVGNADTYNALGKHLTTIDLNYWKDYHGSVCLEND